MARGRGVAGDEKESELAEQDEQKGEEDEVFARLAVSSALA